MGDTDLQNLCELGQQQLMRMDYLRAEATLVDAEHLAWSARDFDTLARLYLPLQEARRQRRQRCGEGVVCLDLLPTAPGSILDGNEIARTIPKGQLLVAGWGCVGPALQIRQAQAQQGLYLETFLAAVYPVGAARAVVIVPLAESSLPPPVKRETIDELLAWLPPHCLVLHENELPKGQRAGTAETYGEVMDLWERLHAPFLAAADSEPDPIRRIDAYRRVIRVDYACELAHQKLSATAKELARRQRVDGSDNMPSSR